MANITIDGTDYNLDDLSEKAKEQLGWTPTYTLEELAQYLETMDDTQRKVKSAMYYPIFILFFLVLVFL